MPVLRFRNFLAASRKPNMLAFGMYQYNANRDLDVIEAYGVVPMAIGFTGVQNGSNKVFVISAPPTLVVFNGLIQSTPGDYTIAGTTVTFTMAPQPDDILLFMAGM
jgi:hypothetical protein